MSNGKDSKYTAYNEFFEGLMLKGAQVGADHFDLLIDHAVEQTRGLLAKHWKIDDPNKIPICNEPKQILGECLEETCVGCFSVEAWDEFQNRVMEASSEPASNNVYATKCIEAVEVARVSRNRSTATYIGDLNRKTTTVFATVLIHKKSASKPYKQVSHYIFLRTSGSQEMEEWQRDDLEVIALMLSFCHACIPQMPNPALEKYGWHPVEKEGRRLLRHLISYRRSVRRAVRGGILESIWSPDKLEGKKAVEKDGHVISRTNQAARSNLLANLDWQEPDGLLGNKVSELYPFEHESDEVDKQLKLRKEEANYNGLIPVTREYEAGLVHLSNPDEPTRKIAVNLTLARSPSLTVGYFEKIGGRYYDLALDNIRSLVRQQDKEAFEKVALAVYSYILVTIPELGAEDVQVGLLAWDVPKTINGVEISDLDQRQYGRLTQVAYKGSEKKEGRYYPECNHDTSKGICRFVSSSKRVWAEFNSGDSENPDWHPISGFTGRSQYLPGNFGAGNYEIAAPILHEKETVGVLDVQVKFSESKEDACPHIVERFIEEAATIISSSFHAYKKSRRAERIEDLTERFAERHKEMLIHMESADTIQARITDVEDGAFRFIFQSKPFGPQPGEEIHRFIHLYEVENATKSGKSNKPRQVTVRRTYRNGKLCPESFLAEEDSSQRSINSIVAAVASREGSVTYQLLTQNAEGTTTFERSGKEWTASYRNHESEKLSPSHVSELAIFQEAGDRKFVINYELGFDNFFDEEIIQILEADAKMCAAILRAALARDQEIETGRQLNAQHYNVRESLHDDSHAVNALKRRYRLVEAIRNWKEEQGPPPAMTYPPDGKDLVKELDFLLSRMRYNAIHSNPHQVSLPVPATYFERMVISYPHHWDCLVRDRLSGIVSDHQGVNVNIRDSFDDDPHSFLEIDFIPTEVAKGANGRGDHLEKFSGSLAIRGGTSGAFAFTALLSGIVRNAVKHCLSARLKEIAQKNDLARFRIFIYGKESPTTQELYEATEKYRPEAWRWKYPNYQRGQGYTSAYRDYLKRFLDEGYVAIRITSNLFPDDDKSLLKHARDLAELAEKMSKETKLRSSHSGVATMWHNALFLRPQSDLEKILDGYRLREDSPPIVIFSVGDDQEGRKGRFENVAHIDDGLTRDEYAYTFFAKVYEEFAPAQATADGIGLSRIVAGDIGVLEDKDWKRLSPSNHQFALAPWAILVSNHKKRESRGNLRFTTEGTPDNAGKAWRLWLEAGEQTEHGKGNATYTIDAFGLDDYKPQESLDGVEFLEEARLSRGTPTFSHSTLKWDNIDKKFWKDSGQPYVEFCPGVANTLFKQWLASPREPQTDEAFLLSLRLAIYSRIAILDTRLDFLSVTEDEGGPVRPPAFIYLPSEWSLADCWRYHGVFLLPVSENESEETPFQEWVKERSRDHYADSLLCLHQGDINGRLIGEGSGQMDAEDKILKLLGEDGLKHLIIHTEHGDHGIAEKWGVRCAGYGPIENALLNGSKVELFRLLAASRGIQATSGGT